MSWSLRTKGGRFPEDYLLFQFCREFGCLPHDADGMDDHRFWLFCEFLRAESDAANMGSKSR